MTMVSTKDLYDEASDDWRRTQPILLSDYTARPFLLEWCEPVTNRDVLDLGCGEGYFARHLKQRGARTILGVDVSPEMISSAQERESTENLGIEYVVGSADNMTNFGESSFDLVVAVFLFNYLNLEQTQHTICEIHRVLRPGGRFVFAVPHPALAFLGEKRAPFYFEPQQHGYYSGRDVQFEGEIWRRDGKSVPVRSVHKTFEDYMSALADGGFDRMPLIAELHVTEEHLALDPEWFGPLRDKPLHLAFQIHK